MTDDTTAETPIPPADDQGAGDRRARTKRIGLRLQQFYDEVASESIPDDFLKLLEDADKGAPSASKVSKSR